MACIMDHIMDQTVNGTQSTMKVNHSYVTLPQGQASDHLASVSHDLVGYDSTAFSLVLEGSGHLRTNGDLLLYQSGNVVHQIKLQPI